jgi:hypothetical protein
LLGSAVELSFLFEALGMLCGGFRFFSLTHLLLQHVRIFKLLPLFLNDRT